MAYARNFPQTIVYLEQITITIFNVYNALCDTIV